MTLEIKNHWEVHRPPMDRPISLRALKPKGVTQQLFPQNRTYHPLDYASLDALKLAFESDALALNSAGYNVYTVMNPIRPDFRRNDAVKDADITHRTTVLIDIDRTGDTSCPASDAEINAAFDLAHKVELYLISEGYSDPWRVNSGNGCHLYYPIPEIPNVETTTPVFECFLRVLTQFNNDIVSIDTSVYNASRITKVIGTLARKGSESDGRPYRMARLV